VKENQMNDSDRSRLVEFIFAMIQSIGLRRNSEDAGGNLIDKARSAFISCSIQEFERHKDSGRE